MADLTLSEISQRTGIPTITLRHHVRNHAAELGATMHMVGGFRWTVPEENVDMIWRWATTHARLRNNGKGT
jgi:hypothetical protein